MTAGLGIAEAPWFRGERIVVGGVQVKSGGARVRLGEIATPAGVAGRHLEYPQDPDPYTE